MGERARSPQRAEGPLQGCGLGRSSLEQPGEDDGKRACQNDAAGAMTWDEARTLANIVTDKGVSTK